QTQAVDSVRIERIEAEISRFAITNPESGEKSTFETITDQIEGAAENAPEGEYIIFDFKSPSRNFLNDLALLLVEQEQLAGLNFQIVDPQGKIVLPFQKKEKRSKRANLVMVSGANILNLEKFADPKALNIFFRELV
ncbi:MAG TPA: hypothetical protein VHA74_02780, partial [Candidatus Dojkabacteria bacterium]|nr:hypothetical protein [Candidatus Dojkabacteria bacterium]